MKKFNLYLVALLGFSMTYLQAVTVVANLGNSTIATDINTQGFSGGIDAANFSGFQTASGNTSMFTFEYNLSDLNLENVDKLEIAVTGSYMLNVAGNNGIAVNGGNDNWYDVGETLTFTMAIKDSEDNDVTISLDTFSLTGFSVRGKSVSGVNVTTTVGGQNLTLDGPQGGYHKKDGFSIDLSNPGSNTIVSERSGANNILQIGQLRFNIAVPETSSYSLLVGLSALGCVMLGRRKFIS